MTTMIDRPESAVDPRLETLERRSRGLVITVAILAIVVLALAGWFLYEQSQSAATAASSEMAQLVDDYTAAMNEYDGEAFLELTTPGYVFTSAGGMEFRQREQADRIEEALPSYLWQVERPGKPMVMGDGPWYVAIPIHTTTNIREADGVSILTIIDDGGVLRVASHVVIGDF